MMVSISLASFCLLMLPSLSMQQCLTSNDSTIHPDADARMALFRGQQEFSLALLNAVNTLTPQTNIFFSPFSIHQTVVLAYFVAANQTEMEIKKGLFLPEKQDKINTLQAYRLERFFQMMRSMNRSSDYEFNSANRMFIAKDLKVKECYLELFRDDMEMVDFAKTQETTELINKWVANQTNDQIQNLIPDGILADDSKLVLANAAFFKGVWKAQFKKELSKKELFYISSSKNAFVTMMKSESSYNYGVSETLGAHILEMPYNGEDISMFVLLPPFASPSGISNVLKRLTLENFREIINGDVLTPRQLKVQFPKFTVEQSIQLVPALEMLGIKIFNSTADFSALTGEPGITFNDAIHKAKIEVTEEGTTAAAATALFSFRSSRPLDPVQFICNHPFIYLIFDRVNETILFVGIYNKPDTQAV